MKKRIKNKNYHGFINDLDDNDDRLPYFLAQYKERGWDNTELWSLDNTLANLILPRLKEFKKIKGGYPSHLADYDKDGNVIDGDIGGKRWNGILDQMISAFDILVNIDYPDKKQCKQIDKGLKLFVKYFTDLWT